MELKSKEILKKAQTILDKTDDWGAFEVEYDQHLRMHGERMVDGAIFVFKLDDDYTLVVRFSDYSFDDFSIIHKSVDKELLLFI